MPSLKDIRLKIESVKNTQQITKAMKLVSAAKLRKAQNQITNLRPYAETLKKVISDIAVTQRVTSPFIKTSADTKSILIVVVTSDRGLCGAFNSQIIKFTESLRKNELKGFEKVEFAFLGKKAADSFARRGVKSQMTMVRVDRDISYQLARDISSDLLKKFTSGQFDEIRIVYNEFKSAISQKPVMERILPIDIETDLGAIENTKATFAKDLVFEPAPELMMVELLEKHFSVQVYRALCESIAAEHGARMTAMENATNNAKEVLAKTTLTYNKLRQEKITTELIEIVSGAEALK